MFEMIRQLLTKMGYEIYRPSAFPPGSAARPVGRMSFFLEDLKARGFEPQVVLDVGAHIGKWSEGFLRVFPGARCFLIEPKAEVADRLDAFCRNHPGCVWFQCGAGCEIGEMSLTLWPNAGQGTSFLPTRKEDLVGKGIQRVVPVKTIDSLIDSGKIPAPDFIKVDTEGFELEVLKGGLRALSTAELVVLEVSLYDRLPRMPIFHEVVEFMAEQEFVLYDIPGFHRRQDSASAGVLFMCDLCFIRRNSPRRPTIRGLYT